MATWLPLIVMVVGLFAGVPIAFALAGAGILGIWLVTGDWQAVMGIVGTSVYRGGADYVLTTVPMFILLAYFTSASGMARNLYRAAASWVSHIPGGLAIGTIIAGAIFGALSGASTAAASSPWPWRSGLPSTAGAPRGRSWATASTCAPCPPS